MAAILTAAVRLFGLGGVLFVVALFFYEGIPGAARLPFVTSIPVVSNLVAGRVETYAADQVRRATAEMVSKFERDALEAQLVKERRDRLAAQLAATEAKLRQDATQRAKDQADAENERLRAQALADKLPTWSEEELQWLDRH